MNCSERRANKHSSINMEFLSRCPEGIQCDSVVAGAAAVAEEGAATTPRCTAAAWTAAERTRAAAGTRRSRAGVAGAATRAEETGDAAVGGTTGAAGAEGAARTGTEVMFIMFSSSWTFIRLLYIPLTYQNYQMSQLVSYSKPNRSSDRDRNRDKDRGNSSGGGAGGSSGNRGSPPMSASTASASSSSSSRKVRKISRIMIC